MKIKYIGKSDVFSAAVGQETGNALITAGQELDLPPSLAKSLLESSQQFKAAKESSKKASPKKEEPANEPNNNNDEEKLDG